ncbi:hypothetical protein BKA62DRAFT_702056 [Auriculariales sp. MPI-PUGE-AT-0066]|nr:hypothetical protein BKA62DRAFT_702056 [Auriculariales sp. MPI-PUGE-AT-0066]
MTLDLSGSHNPWDDNSNLPLRHQDDKVSLSPARHAHGLLSPDGRKPAGVPNYLNSKSLEAGLNSTFVDSEPIGWESSGSSETSEPAWSNVSDTHSSPAVPAPSLSGAVLLEDNGSLLAPTIRTHHVRSHTVDFASSAHPLSHPPSPTSSRGSSPEPPEPPEPGEEKHVVAPGDSLAGIALRYGVNVAALRRANGLWANDSIHLRKTLTIPLDGDSGGSFLQRSADSNSRIVGGHARAATTLSPATSRHARAVTFTTDEFASSSKLPMPARDRAAVFSLTLPRIRLSLDGLSAGTSSDKDNDTEAEHELIPLIRGAARRQRVRPPLVVSKPTTKQPGPTKGMMVPRVD